MVNMPLPSIGPPLGPTNLKYLPPPMRYVGHYHIQPTALSDGYKPRYRLPSAKTRRSGYAQLSKDCMCITIPRLACRLRLSCTCIGQPLLPASHPRRLCSSVAGKWRSSQRRTALPARLCSQTFLWGRSPWVRLTSRAQSQT